MLEVGVAYLVEQKGFSRHKATILLFVLTFIVGVFCSLSFGPLGEVKIFGDRIFDFLDMLCSDYLMSLGALLFALFVGWKLDRQTVYDELTNHGTIRTNVRIFPVVYFLIKYMAPLAIIVIFITGLLA